MKMIFFSGLLAWMASGYGAEIRILEYSKEKNLVALEVRENIEHYKVGQDLKLTFPTGSSCSYSVTKVIPEKYRFFADTSRCLETRLLIPKTILKDEAPEGSFVLSEEKETSSLPTINESWYTYWGLGVSSIKYSSSTEAAIDALEARASVDRTSLGLDLFGFYWPLEDKKSIVGFVVNAVSDTFEVGSEELTLRQYLYSFSGMTFFGPNVGSEWFLRGDIGLAKYVAEIKATNTTTLQATSKTGYGVLIGGGYAWPLGTETRLLLNLNFARRKVKDSGISTGELAVGFLF